MEAGLGMHCDRPSGMAGSLKKTVLVWQEVQPREHVWKTPLQGGGRERESQQRKGTVTRAMALATAAGEARRHGDELLPSCSSDSDASAQKQKSRQNDASAAAESQLTSGRRQRRR